MYTVLSRMILLPCMTLPWRWSAPVWKIFCISIILLPTVVRKSWQATVPPWKKKDFSPTEASCSSIRDLMKIFPLWQTSCWSCMQRESPSTVSLLLTILWHWVLWNTPVKWSCGFLRIWLSSVIIIPCWWTAAIRSWPVSTISWKHSASIWSQRWWAFWAEARCRRRLYSPVNW